MKAHGSAQLLTPEAADDLQAMPAVEMAQAHAQLLRVAAVRAKLIAAFKGGPMNLK